MRASHPISVMKLLICGTDVNHTNLILGSKILIGRLPNGDKKVL